MSKRLTKVLGASLLLFSLAALAVVQAQTPTTTQVVQNSDGTYTIVEYPVGKETIVTLNPVGLSGATGTATILRAADGTAIKVNLTSLPTEVTAMSLYAVEPTGKVTLLGPVTITNGAGTFTTSVPLSRFMLFTSAEPGLSIYNDTTPIFFRSAAPTGLAVIPLSAPMGEKVAADVATVATPVDVPMLGIPAFKKGDDTKLKVNFSGAMEGARANIFIEPHKRANATEVRMRFHDLKEAPKGQAFILWAVSPDGQYQRLGQVVNTKGRNEAEIKSETTLPDFGLLLTTESAASAATIVTPAGARVGVIQIIK